MTTRMTREEMIAKARDEDYRGVMQHCRSYEEIDNLLMAMADELEAMTVPSAPKQLIAKTNIINENCKHLKFAVKAKVEKNFDVLELSLVSMSPTTPKYTVKMSVQCNECGVPFHFANPLSPSTSIDGTELRIGILPKSLVTKRTLAGKIDWA